MTKGQGESDQRSGKAGVGMVVSISMAWLGMGLMCMISCVTNVLQVWL
jgi:hypothetical protein